MIVIFCYLATEPVLFFCYADDHIPYSLNPPMGLAPDKIPQFVSIGSDDNGFSGLKGSGGKGGLKWILDFFRNKKNPRGKGISATFDGCPCRISFYVSAALADNGALEKKALIQKMWHQAWLDGHEIGNHTYSHANYLQFSTNEKTWETEIDQCNAILTAPYIRIISSEILNPPNGIGIKKSEIYGFRTPFLAYTDETITAIQNKGFLYDCSIEEGWQAERDGSNYCWPYTLDHGSPGDKWSWDKPPIHAPRPIGQHSGLWEFPLHPFIAPPDEKYRVYAFTPGLRKKLKKKILWFDEATGKLPSFDYNLFCQYGLSKEEVLAILKYSFDLTYNGNRTPFQLGIHTDIYSSKYPINNGTNYKERQWVIEQFVRYVLVKPEVRIVPAYQIIRWCINPAPLCL